jgi:hypothetical protein
MRNGCGGTSVVAMVRWAIRAPTIPSLFLEFSQWLSEKLSHDSRPQPSHATTVEI